MLTALFLLTSAAYAGDEDEVNPGITELMAREDMRADAAAKLAGTWNVTTTQDADANCSIAEPGKVNAYIWIVSTDRAGSLTVSVQGETSYPKLTGTVTYDGNVRLGATTDFVAANGYRATTISFTLKLNSAGELVGTRRFLGYNSVALTNGATGVVPCFLDATVKAKR